MAIFFHNLHREAEATLNAGKTSILKDTIKKNPTMFVPPPTPAVEGVLALGLSGAETDRLKSGWREVFSRVLIFFFFPMLQERREKNIT